MTYDGYEALRIAIENGVARVTIDHPPIKALHWGAMTMAFKADPALLKGVSRGSKVVFRLKDQKLVSLKTQ